MTEAEFLAHLAVIDSLLWYYAKRLERTRGVPAEDLVQHARMTLWADRGKAAGHPSPSQWFGQAARWAMWNLVRAESRSPRALLVADDNTVPPTAAPEPGDFESIVGRLPPPLAEVLRRRFVADESREQMGAALGVSTWTISQRTAKAYSRLRATLRV